MSEITVGGDDSQSQGERTRREAIQSVQEAEAFLVFTAKEGRIIYNGYVPPRFPLPHLSGLIAAVQKRAHEVVSFYSQRANTKVGLSKPPPGFDPRKMG